jgi:RNA-dependent RNA polymerase
MAFRNRRWDLRLPARIRDAFFYRPSRYVHPFSHYGFRNMSRFSVEQYPDRSNRVIRSYPSHQQYFVRVQFCEEDYLHFRFDRDIDGEHFIKTRVGGTLRQGIMIGGRSFEFLAYSQSALKVFAPVCVRECPLLTPTQDHAVWFVRPFKLNSQWVTADSIRKSLGSFDKVIQCPSLYGARMSQAFTATDPSVTISAQEMKIIPDIERVDDSGRVWQFTDGMPSWTVHTSLRLTCSQVLAQYPVSSSTTLLAH